MAIPDFQTIMLPLLSLMSDQNERHVRDIIDHLADVFELSAEEKRTLLPSGKEMAFDNKVRWSRLHLSKAGLLESTRRGYSRITESGLGVLSQGPSKIDIKFLEGFPEYREWKKTFSREAKEPAQEPEQISEQTPEEAMEYGYQQLRDELRQQVLRAVAAVSPKFFERLVVELLVKMGYGGTVRDAAKVVGGASDEGIDGVIKEDRLGLDTIYVQAKRWQGVVGRPRLMEFVGALRGQKANKGVFITTSKFTNDAIDYVSKVDSRVVLIDGEQLAELMIDFHIGVSPFMTYEIQKLDSDYFSDD